MTATTALLLAIAAISVWTIIILLMLDKAISRIHNKIAEYQLQAIDKEHERRKRDKEQKETIQRLHEAYRELSEDGSCTGRE
jgi:hypothetical protein